MDHFREQIWTQWKEMNSLATRTLQIGKLPSEVVGFPIISEIEDIQGLAECPLKEILQQR